MAAIANHLNGKQQEQEEQITDFDGVIWPKLVSRYELCLVRVYLFRSQ